eukprot:tig00021434_g21359.t1
MTRCGAGAEEAVALIELPKVRQLSHWDCGLACCQMVLRKLKKRCTFDEMRKLCPTKSVWTIDLARLLNFFEVQFIYFTTQIGVNPDYSDADFYKESYDEDAKRVERLFADAPQLGIRIEHRTFSSDEMQRTMLGGRHVYVALVDKRYLACASCGGGRGAAPPGASHEARRGGGRGEAEEAGVGAQLSSLVASCIPASIASAFSNSSYIGHYVVVVGIDSRKGQFLVKDPAREADLCHIPFAAFDRARLSFGTDEDLILVSLE